MKRAKASLLAKASAVLAGLAILLQAAAFAPASAAEIIEVCTAHGVEKIIVPADDGAPAMPGDCGHCGHCVMASPAGLPESRAAAPVRYSAEAAEVVTSTAFGPRLARAPPRPPGQGPPAI